MIFFPNIYPGQTKCLSVWVGTIFLFLEHGRYHLLRNAKTTTTALFAYVWTLIALLSFFVVSSGFKIAKQSALQLRPLNTVDKNIEVSRVQPNPT